MPPPHDDAIAGAGVLGLAHAYHLARRGRRVIVFERNPRAWGASVRNFGMLWPIGQPAGPMRQLALRSLEIWRGILRESGLWHNPCGSLHLAYRADEMQILKEFANTAPQKGYDVSLLDPGEVCERAPAVRADGLLGGLYSPVEVCIDPRQVIAELPGWLARTYGVEFQFNHLVTDYEHPNVVVAGETWPAKRLWVCSGEDLQTLYSHVLGEWGLQRCKLQMMRSQAYGDRFRIGPMLAGGLTLRHYLSFADCRSLPALKQRVAAEMPEFDQYGIHVMASQNGQGEVVIGDSHEYNQENAEPFNKDVIDRLILDYLRSFLDLPDLHITQRWQGVYMKHASQPYLVAQPAKGVTLINGVGGNGMTLSFGLAEHVVNMVLENN